MKVAVLLPVLLLLAGCEQKTWTRDEIVDIADDSAPPDTSGEVADLEDRVAAIEERLDLQQRQVSLQSEIVNATADQVSRNAEVNNENAVNDMTRRGACGKQWVAIEGGGSYLRNVECTKADLRE